MSHASVVAIGTAAVALLVWIAPPVAAQAPEELSFRDYLVELTLAPLRSNEPEIPGRSAKARLRSPLTAAPSRPALASRELFIEQTMRRMDPERFAAGPGCCPCVVDDSCSDMLFCNGREVCLSGACAPGPESCNDGDPCTADSCVENTDTCVNDNPAPSPPDVAQLDVVSAGAAFATLQWSPVTEATGYNIYRAAASDLSDITCFDAAVTGTTQLDDGIVPIDAFFYLVTAVAGCGESGIGTGDPGSRPDTPVCIP